MSRMQLYKWHRYLCVRGSEWELPTSKLGKKGARWNQTETSSKLIKEILSFPTQGQTHTVSLRPIIEQEFKKDYWWPYFTAAVLCAELQVCAKSFPAFTLLQDEFWDGFSPNGSDFSSNRLKKSTFLFCQLLSVKCPHLLADTPTYPANSMEWTLRVQTCWDGTKMKPDIVSPVFLLLLFKTAQGILASCRWRCRSPLEMDWVAHGRRLDWMCIVELITLGSLYGDMGNSRVWLAHLLMLANNSRYLNCSLWISVTPADCKPLQRSIPNVGDHQPARPNLWDCFDPGAGPWAWPQQTPWCLLGSTSQAHEGRSGWHPFHLQCHLHHPAWWQVSWAGLNGCGC